MTDLNLPGNILNENLPVDLFSSGMAYLAAFPHKFGGKGIIGRFLCVGEWTVDSAAGVEYFKELFKRNVTDRVWKFGKHADLSIGMVWIRRHHSSRNRKTHAIRRMG
jgi:hypothetical protein